MSNTNNQDPPGSTVEKKTDFDWLKDIDLSKSRIEEWYQVVTGQTDDDGPGFFSEPPPKIIGYTPDKRAARLFGEKETRFSPRGYTWEIRPITVLIDQSGYAHPIKAEVLSPLIDGEKILEELKQATLKSLTEDQRYVLKLTT